MTRLEILQIVRHEMRAAIENLSAILAHIGEPRLPPAEIPRLVNAAEDSLRSLAHLTDSLRTVLETDARPTQLKTKENLYDIANAAIATLARATRGARINLQGNQNVQLICDRRKIEFLLTSLLIFLLKGLRYAGSGNDIRITVEDAKETAHIDMRFHLGLGWHEREAEDDKITWMMATMLIRNCRGSIEPRELTQLSQRLKLSFRKR